MDSFPCSPWSSKHPKMVQPDLDYLAPEIQVQGSKHCSTDCDMFSLGMTICAVYNQGKSLLQANHNPSVYSKKIDQVRQKVNYNPSVYSKKADQVRHN